MIEALNKEGLRPKVKVIVGGAPVTRRWAEEIGADGYGKDALSADSRQPAMDLVPAWTPAPSALV